MRASRPVSGSVHVYASMTCNRWEACGAIAISAQLDGIPTPGEAGHGSRYLASGVDPANMEVRDV